ncbi:MAG: hypothetical protein HZC49_03255 [Nitrospirae bacterium]|nr:hypothetical protein [Nitrospirota bacterium]
MIISILLMLVISLSLIVTDVAVAGDERPFVRRQVVVTQAFDEDFGKVIIVKERPVIQRLFNPFLFKNQLFFEEEDFFDFERRPFFEEKRFERERDD